MRIGLAVRMAGVSGALRGARGRVRHRSGHDQAAIGKRRSSTDAAVKAGAPSRAQESGFSRLAALAAQRGRPSMRAPVQTGE